MTTTNEKTCRVCGCTEEDCKQCIEKTGTPCHWVEEDLCSACQTPDMFLFKMDHCLNSKNKMDAEINKFLFSMDGTLIHSSEDLEYFKDLLQERVEEIHSRHPRCKQLRLNIWSLYNEDQIAVSCGCSSAKIYSAKQNFMQP